jgi:hypothetical protein
MRTNRANSRVQKAVLLLAAAMTIVAAASTLRAQSAVELAERARIFDDPSSPPGRSVLASDDERFLDELQRRGIQFFIDEADPVSGLMPDRAEASGGSVNNVSSIASVGFGLTALCVGAERGWVPKQDAYERCLRVLRFLLEHGEQHHGHFYHFLDMRSGQRAWDCEVSNIDTALLMAGVLTARQYFANTELVTVAKQLYERVEWPWLLTSEGVLSMGWKPESGFIPARWDHFSEGAPLIILLGMGSPTHPLPSQAWQKWRRGPVTTYAGLTYMQCPPLFTHQFPQCWFDLRGLRDNFANYFRNSQLATIAHRQWSIDELSKRFPTYGPKLWGLTASDFVDGYTAWGGPPAQGPIDGSVVPCAAAGSLVFEPRLCLEALKHMREQYGEKGWQKYGFVDAFNPATGWYNADVIGIDVGPTVVMAENCRSGFVWKTFMSNPEAHTALKAAGMRAVDSRDAVPASTSIFNTVVQQSGDRR